MMILGYVATSAVVFLIGFIFSAARSLQRFEELTGALR